MRSRSLMALSFMLLAAATACQQARDDQASTNESDTKQPPAERDTLCWEPFTVPDVDAVPGATAGPRNGTTGSAAAGTRRCDGVGVLGVDRSMATPVAGDPRIGMKRTVKCGTGGTCTVKLHLQFSADVFPPPQNEKVFVTLRRAGQPDVRMQVSRNHPAGDLFEIRIPGCGDVDVMINFEDGGPGTTPGIQGEIAHARIVEATCG